MSFYDDASLVVIPSAQKTSKLYAVKPTDGSGDLAFTRTGDTATRVNSAGLIEKVRTNLLTYSNTFSNAAWLNDDSTETSGQAGYDGTTNAWLLAKTAANGRISEVLTVSGSATFSIYAKAGTDSWLFLASSDAGVNAYFNLGTGAVGSTGASTTAAITSVGNGWYRCSISGNASFTYFNIWIADANNDTSGASGNILIQSAQVETGDVATDYIATTTAAVSVGPVANVPRLDYLGSTCGKLLLEPQRTNAFTFSEQFDNAAWTKYQATISANSAVSPDGYINADKLIDSTANDIHSVYRGYTFSANSTISFFVKAAEYSRIAISNLSDGGEVIFNLTTASVVSTSANFTNNKIESYGNGWYRISATTNGVSGAKAVGLSLVNNAGATTFTGTGTSGILIFGAQLEDSAAYATSLIPTLAASATRGAEVTSKGSISSLIGSTEGSAYFNGIVQDSGAASAVFLEIVAGTDASNAIVLYVDNSTGRVAVYIGTLPGSVFLSSTSKQGQNVKIAFRWKTNSFAFYLDGAQVYTNNTIAAPVGMNNLRVGNNRDGVDIGTNKVNNVLLFNTALTNAELAELTTL